MQTLDQKLDIDDASLPWRSTRHRGIAWLPLHAAEAGPRGEPEAERATDATVLIRMDPGCGYPRHRHNGVEEVMILRGGYRDELGEHRAGSYVRYAAGSEHTPVALGDPGRPVGRENQACVLYSIARGGVRNLE